MRLFMLALAGSVVIARVAATANTVVAPKCKIQITNVDRDFARRELFNNSTNVTYDAGGNVRMRCIGQQVFLNADSVSALSEDHYQLFGHAVYSDSTYRFAADTMLYIVRTEKLEARGNVTVLDKLAGSTLKGPYVDYYRQVKGVNDSARVEALMRPTVRYLPRPAPGDLSKQSPYVITAAHLKGFGQSRLTADSAVTFDRDSVHAAGDSLAVDRAKITNVLLVGKVARVRRAGSDSFAIAGRRIWFQLVDDRLKEVRSFLDANVVRGATVVTGDTVMISFAADKLGLTLAWNRKTGATIHSEGYDVVGDSVAVDTPGELLREIRLFGHGMIRNPRDTTIRYPSRVPGEPPMPDSTRNSLWGERVIAKFDQIDSTGTLVPRLQGLRAFGKGILQARSLFVRSVTAKDGTVSPSINYTRADSIFMKMEGGSSSELGLVQAYGHVDGAQLEMISVAKPKADTSKPAPATGRP